MALQCLFLLTSVVCSLLGKVAWIIMSSYTQRKETDLWILLITNVKLQSSFRRLKGLNPVDYLTSAISTKKTYAPKMRLGLVSKHPGERPYDCPFCLTGVTSWSNAKRHTLAHRKKNSCVLLVWKWILLIVWSQKASEITRICSSDAAYTCNFEMCSVVVHTRRCIGMKYCNIQLFPWPWEEVFFIFL